MDYQNSERELLARLGTSFCEVCPNKLTSFMSSRLCSTCYLQFICTIKAPVQANAMTIWISEERERRKLYDEL